VWLTVSMTLFVVALVLLLLIERDQRRAVHALQLAAAGQSSPALPEDSGAAGTAGAAELGAGEGPAKDGKNATAESEQDPEPEQSPRQRPGEEIARVERGRIASMSGVVSLIWLVILFLMVWYSRG
jgi:hypothetical protein